MEHLADRNRFKCQCRVLAFVVCFSLIIIRDNSTTHIGMVAFTVETNREGLRESMSLFLMPGLHHTWK